MINIIRTTKMIYRLDEKNIRNKASVQIKFFFLPAESSIHGRQFSPAENRKLVILMSLTILRMIIMCSFVAIGERSGQ